MAQPTELKSSQIAIEWSVGGTLASLVLIGVGASSHNGGLATVGVVSSLVTPSLGEWYAGDYVTAGMGIRVASTLVAIVGFGSALCNEIGDGCKSGQQSTGAALMLVGGAGYVTGAIYDIATAGSAADSFNRKHALKVAPTVLTPPSGPVYGLGIGGRF